MNNKGQALVETSIIILILFIFILCLFQLVFLTVFSLVACDATYTATRASIVGRDPQTAMWFVFSSQIPLGLPTGLDISYKDCATRIKDHQNNMIKIHMVDIQAISRVMFGSFFGKPLGIFKINTSSRMVGSPDSRYYHKSFPQAEADM